MAPTTATAAEGESARSRDGVATTTPVSWQVYTSVIHNIIPTFGKIYDIIWQIQCLSDIVTLFG